MTIRWWHVLTVVAVLSITGCGQGGAAAPPPGAAEIWGRTFVSAPDEGSKRLVEGTRLRLGFEPGTVTAEAGCNHLSGRAAVDGDRLVVSDVGGTMMACSAELMDQDTWLTDFLQQRPRWQLDGDTLVLSAGTTRLRLVDIRSAEPDRPLTGPRWSVQSLIDGDAAASVPAGADAHLTFRDGRVTGSTGCTDVDGAASIGDGSITFSRLTSRGKACPPELEALERTVLGLLNGKLAYRITGDRLTLTRADGDGLDLRAAP
ncbi:META domain-containing protein [Amorphoplanes digitatis]|uniref:Heat shock protein HslJ n=1 Tax=Actinoplanes digitatis TaxID=1868 RepID=A0A7W7I3V1_9ACTN|nr:META domain-containing protein [Actinoplanes digitatis]MBB4765781.1 heat shock protein HslJ [Actinoplanes digitatis]